MDILNPCQYGEDLGALLNIEVDENDGVFNIKTLIWQKIEKCDLGFAKEV